MISPCRKCNEPDCRLCNIFTLIKALEQGKFDGWMDDNKHVHVYDTNIGKSSKDTNVHSKSIPNQNRLTNGDKLRAMSDEELAVWIELRAYEAPWCKDDAPVDPVTKECLVPHQFCWECVLDWLKQEI